MRRIVVTGLSILSVIVIAALIGVQPAQSQDDFTIGVAPGQGPPGTVFNITTDVNTTCFITGTDGTNLSLTAPGGRIEHIGFHDPGTTLSIVCENSLGGRSNTLTIRITNSGGETTTQPTPDPGGEEAAPEPAPLPSLLGYSYCAVASAGYYNVNVRAGAGQEFDVQRVISEYEVKRTNEYTFDNDGRAWYLLSDGGWVASWVTRTGDNCGPDQLIGPEIEVENRNADGSISDRRFIDLDELIESALSECSALIPQVRQLSRLIQYIYVTSETPCESFLAVLAGIGFFTDPQQLPVPKDEDGANACGPGTFVALTHLLNRMKGIDENTRNELTEQMEEDQDCAIGEALINGREIPIDDFQTPANIKTISLVCEPGLTDETLEWVVGEFARFDLRFETDHNPCEYPDLLVKIGTSDDGSSPSTEVSEPWLGVFDMLQEICPKSLGSTLADVNKIIDYGYGADDVPTSGDVCRWERRLEPNPDAGPRTGNPTAVPTGTGNPTAVPTDTGNPTAVPTDTGNPTAVPTDTGNPTAVPTPTSTTIIPGTNIRVADLDYDQISALAVVGGPDDDVNAGAIYGFVGDDIVPWLTSETESLMYPVFAPNRPIVAYIRVNDEIPGNPATLALYLPKSETNIELPVLVEDADGVVTITGQRLPGYTILKSRLAWSPNGDELLVTLFNTDTQMPSIYRIDVSVEALSRGAPTIDVLIVDGASPVYAPIDNSQYLGHIAFDRYLEDEIVPAIYNPQVETDNIILIRPQEWDACRVETVHPLLILSAIFACERENGDEIETGLVLGDPLENYTEIIVPGVDDIRHLSGRIGGGYFTFDDGEFFYLSYMVRGLDPHILQLISSPFSLDDSLGIQFITFFSNRDVFTG